MIFQPIINFVVDTLTVVSNQLTLNGNIEVPDNVFQAVSSLFGFLGWFFPIGRLLPLLLFTLAFYGLRASLAIVRFIRGFIPTLGG